MSKQDNGPQNLIDELKQHLPTGDEVVNYIEHSGGRVKRGTIAKHFKLKGMQRRAMRELLQDLAKQHRIELLGGNLVGLPRPLPSPLVIHIFGQGADLELLAKPEDRGLQNPNIIIRVDSQMDLGIGDTVEANITHLEGNEYVAHPFRKVGNEAEKPVLGSFTNLGKGLPGQVVPLDPDRLPRRFLVTAETARDIPDGAIVLGKPISSGDKFTPPMLELIEVVGHQAEGAESLIAIHSFNIPYIFPNEVLDYTETLPNGLTDKELAEREDLRDVPICTIDGPDARDFDDAVWVNQNEDGSFKVIVAIADVAQYVQEGSPLDKEAFNRGNSTYFPDRVVPMLPERLSNNLCSLRPNEDRPVLACHMTISAEGKLLKKKFTRAVIHSHARLTYDQVMDAINGNFDELTEPLWDVNLKHAYACYKVLLKAREKRHALDLDMPETKIIVGAHGEIVDVTKRERHDAHRLIEELMIIANVAAAEALEDHKAPCIYRVHPAPSPEKMENLRMVLREYNLKLEKVAAINPKHLTGLIAQIHDHPEEELLMQTILRSQQQAVYTPDNEGHFGLSLQKYAHFTSPIRRYSDLIVHRSLIKAYNLPGKGELKTPRSRFSQLAEHICITERRSQRAEWDAKDRLVARYYKEKRGMFYDARVMSVQKFGLFVSIEDGVGEGLLPMRYLGDEYFKFDPRRGILQGEKTKKEIKIGDKMRVTLTDADVLSGQLTFAYGEVKLEDLPERIVYDPNDKKTGRGRGRAQGPAKGKGGDEPLSRRAAKKAGRTFKGKGRNKSKGKAHGGAHSGGKKAR